MRLVLAFGIALMAHGFPMDDELTSLTMPKLDDTNMVLKSQTNDKIRARLEHTPPPSTQNFDDHAEALERNESSAVKAQSDGMMYFAMAHMANSMQAIDWAIEEGANAVEIDVGFDNDMYVQHNKPGGICDCTCSAFAGAQKELNLCSNAWFECAARFDLPDVLRHLSSKSALAQVYIDSKYATMKDSLYSTGSRMAQALLKHLFGWDGTTQTDVPFIGFVTIGVPVTSHIEYLRGAIAELKLPKNSEFADRVFYAIDQAGGKKDVDGVIKALVDLGTPNRAYANGISACMPDFMIGGTFGNTADVMSAAARRFKEGLLSMGPTAWTVDRESAMKQVVDQGAGSIMTNRPRVAVKVLKDAGKVLALPGAIPKPARTSVFEVKSAILQSGECCLLVVWVTSEKSCARCPGDHEYAFSCTFSGTRRCV